MKGLASLFLLAFTLRPQLAQAQFPILEDTEKVAVTMPALADSGESRIEVIKARPEIRFSKWDREADLIVRYNGFSALGVYSAERMVWAGVAQTMRAYSLAAKAGMEEGGHEIELILLSKPASNTFDFTLTGAENLDFFPQPALTAEEIALGASRPENVIDSIAVYHKTVRNHRIGAKNYATGKAFHMFRAEAVDAIGRRQWLTQTVSGTLWRIVCPQAFLDSAVYPVTIGPTFGYTTEGGSEEFSNSPVFCKFTAPAENGTITSMQAWVRNAGPTAEDMGFAIYSNGSPAEPLNKLAEDSGNVSIPTNGGASQLSPAATVSYVFTASTVYWLAQWSGDAGGEVSYRYDAGSADQQRTRFGQTFETWPDPGGTGAGNARQVSIYATYTAAGGAAPKLLSLTGVGEAALVIPFPIFYLVRKLRRAA